MTPMLNLVLFGPPGAGKGTQSKKLCDTYNLVHLSTGDLLRDEIARATSLGMQAKQIMDKGELVGDHIVISMIEAKLDANPQAQGFIFDGFPRTQAQAQALDELLKKKKTAISMMIALEVNDEELTQRLLLRGANSGRADDRSEEVIRRRIYEYNSKTAPLKQYYAAQNKFHSVYGMGSVENIFELLCATINNKTKPKEPFHDGLVTVADINVQDEPAKHLKVENKAKKKPAKKTVKRVEKRIIKKATKKTSKKTITKKAAAKKISKKTAKKKGTPKKAAKKAVKKAPKKTAKKPAKKILKKVKNKKKR